MPKKHEIHFKSKKKANQIVEIIQKNLFEDKNIIKENPLEDKTTENDDKSFIEMLQEGKLTQVALLLKKQLLGVSYKVITVGTNNTETYEIIYCDATKPRPNLSLIQQLQFQCAIEGLQYLAAALKYILSYNFSQRDSVKEELSQFAIQFFELAFNKNIISFANRTPFENLQRKLEDGLNNLIVQVNKYIAEASIKTSDFKPSELNEIIKTNYFVEPTIIATLTQIPNTQDKILFIEIPISANSNSDSSRLKATEDHVYHLKTDGAYEEIYSGYQMTRCLPEDIDGIREEFGSKFRPEDEESTKLLNLLKKDYLDLFSAHNAIANFQSFEEKNTEYQPIYQTVVEKLQTLNEEKPRPSSSITLTIPDKNKTIQVKLAAYKEIMKIAEILLKQMASQSPEVIAKKTLFEKLQTLYNPIKEEIEIRNTDFEKLRVPFKIMASLINQIVEEDIIFQVDYWIQEKEKEENLRQEAMSKAIALFLPEVNKSLIPTMINQSNHLFPIDSNITPIKIIQPISWYKNPKTLLAIAAIAIGIALCATGIGALAGAPLIGVGALTVGGGIGWGAAILTGLWLSYKGTKEIVKEHKIYKETKSLEEPGVPPPPAQNGSQEIALRTVGVSNKPEISNDVGKNVQFTTTVSPNASQATSEVPFPANSSTSTAQTQLQANSPKSRTQSPTNLPDAQSQTQPQTQTQTNLLTSNATMFNEEKPNAKGGGTSPTLFSNIPQTDKNGYVGIDNKGLAQQDPPNNPHSNLPKTGSNSH